MVKIYEVETGKRIYKGKSYSFAMTVMETLKEAGKRVRVVFE